ncbi:MAG: hypothetical protein AAFY26_13080 [Cyanobacteria bacterium J06638_22]
MVCSESEVWAIAQRIEARPMLDRTAEHGVRGETSPRTLSSP